MMFLAYYYQFIIGDIIKVTNEHTDEEAHRARSGWDLSTGLMLPVELGGANSWYMHVFTDPEAPLHNFKKKSLGN